MTMITEGYMVGTTVKAEPSASRIPAGAQVGADETQAGMIGKLLAAVAALAPMGYEDEAGFHYGAEPRLPER